MLFALVEHGTAWRTKLPPPCRGELRALLGEQLDALPTTSAYRDGTAAIPLDPEATELLRPGGWALFARAIGPRTILARLVLVPRIRELYARAMRDDALVMDALAPAVHRALEAGHVFLRTEHVLRVIATQRWLAPVLDVLASQGGRPATSDVFLYAASKSADVRTLLARAGISDVALRFVLAHGTPPGEADADAPALALVLHDDDFTTGALVHELLVKHAGVAARAARALVRAIDTDGEAVAGIFPAAEARARAQAMRADADKQRAPLRITLRAATS